jgi:hypothetical protein
MGVDSIKDQAELGTDTAVSTLPEGNPTQLDVTEAIAAYIRIITTERGGLLSVGAQQMRRDLNGDPKFLSLADQADRAYESAMFPERRTLFGSRDLGSDVSLPAEPISLIMSRSWGRQKVLLRRSRS